MGYPVETLVSVGFLGSIGRLVDSLGWSLEDADEQFELATEDLGLLYAETLYDTRRDIELSDKYIVGVRRLTYRDPSSVFVTVDNLSDVEREQLEVAASRLGLSATDIKVVVTTNFG